MYAQHDPFKCALEGTEGAQHRQNGKEDRYEDTSLFCPPSLWAFSLHFKTWRRVSPLDLTGVPKRDKPFDDELYMDSSRKIHFKSIALEYQDILKQSKSSEVTTQKGGSLNVLLCGNTGVGKTFTAGKSLPNLICLSQKLHCLILCN